MSHTHQDRASRLKAHGIPSSKYLTINVTIIFLVVFLCQREGAEAGDLCRNMFNATLTLFGSRGKVVALQKLRISSPNTKKCQGGKHRSNRLAALFFGTEAGPSGVKCFFCQK